MEYSFCPNCGKKIEENHKFCPYCGTEMENIDNENIGKTQSDSEETYVYKNEENVPNDEKITIEDQGGKGHAIASLVLGIVSCVFGLCSIELLIGLICGIVGITQANKALEYGINTTMRKAGKILSVIGVALCAVGIFSVILKLIQLKEYM